MFSSFTAAPAISSILLVPLSRRWPRLQSSPVLAGLMGAVMTFIIIYVIIAFFAALDGRFYDLNSIFMVFPYAAAVVVATALWFQFRHRATFNLSRGAGIGAGVMVPIIILLAGP
jgi:H+/Cl- antiporter ClcA